MWNTYQQKPIKALLYSHLPFSSNNDQQNWCELQELRNLIQAILNKKNIPVQVSFSTKEQRKKFYDPCSINQLFEKYDIVQLDVIYLYAVKHKLLKLKKDELKYYDDVFSFQWDPVRIFESGQQYFIGSPGLMCSHFIQTIHNQELIKQRQSVTNDIYILVYLYSSFYLSEVEEQSIQKIDYSDLNMKVIDRIVQFLKYSQSEQTKKFNPQLNTSWNEEIQANFFNDQKYWQTIGYSENIFHFFTKLKKAPSIQDIQVSHIMQNKKKILFYLDEFVAKDNPDPSYKQAIIRFYQSMISNQVLSLYTSGTYTKIKNKKTYLLPPTKQHFDLVRKNDPLYQQYYKQICSDQCLQIPVYGQKYGQNMKPMYKKIVNAILNHENCQKERQKKQST